MINVLQFLKRMTAAHIHLNAVSKLRSINIVCNINNINMNEFYEMNMDKINEINIYEINYEININ